MCKGTCCDMHNASMCAILKGMYVYYALLIYRCNIKINDGICDSICKNPEQSRKPNYSV